MNRNLMKTYKSIAAEAAEYNIRIEKTGGYIHFASGDNTPAWMTKAGSGANAYWFGQTASPDVTGVKRGTKGEVADWCLDWAANGF